MNRTARGRLAKPAKRPARLVSSRAFSAAPGFALLLLASVALVLSASGQQPANPQPAVRFSRGGSAAEIPMEFVSNAVFVPVRIGVNRPSSWLLDTGSATTTADPAVYTPSAATNGPAASVALALPGLDLIEPNLAVRSLKPLEPWYGQRVGGVIGNDLLTHLVAELNYARMSIELYDPASYKSPGHIARLDVRWVGGLPTVHAELRLAGRTISGDFVLVTGGNFDVALSPSFLSAQRIPLTLGKTVPSQMIDASGEREVALTRANWFQFASRRVSQPIVAIPLREDSSSSSRADSSKEKSVAGWIGGGILSKFRVILDFPENRVLAEPNRDFVFPILADASGATVMAVGDNLDQFEIRGVRDGSPAADAGLEPGDRLVLIDGEKSSDFSLDQLRELLTQAGKSPVLVVDRLGRRVTIELHLKQLL